MCFEGQWRWTHHFLLVVWLLAPTSPKAHGYFLGDTKAVLNGCEDYWTLQEWAAMPLLFQMTVCVDIRVVVPGAWVAFSYSSVHAPRPDLGLEGDDEALYGWLLRVRHRFPIRLSPTHWHRVCLRRDVRHNSFSLEVDGQMVAERTVIAQAIPPSGSLWLGCRPRDRLLGAAPGEVELYLFRMWADLGDHGLCEDGTVIGWDAYNWGVTSAKARQRDPNLLCGDRLSRPGARAYRNVINAVSSAITTASGRLLSPPPGKLPSTTTTSSPVIATPVTRATNQTSEITGSPLVNCDISQLCSNKNAYFWMSISVKADGGKKTEQDVHNLVSNAFGCHGDRDDKAHEVTDFMDFCQGDRRLQVNCSAKRDIRETTCDVLLQLSHAVSACQLQRAGASALQQAGDEQIQATIIGEVERVGRDLCGDVEPPSGGFVRCTSTSSLDDICRANKHSELTCSRIEPNSNPAPQPKAESCSREAPRFCDCTAFCNSTSQFFAIRININSASVDVKLLKRLLSTLGRCNTSSGSDCQEILHRYQGAHLECHGNKQRLYSCMVILEMSGPVNSCSLNALLQQIIGSNSVITNERPLTRMVVCGPPDLPVGTLLASNLTWVASDLLTSDVCQSDPTLLKCEANEKLAVLLTDSCPPTSDQSTTQPPTLTHSNITTAPEASPPSVTNATEQTYSTAENTAAVQQTNASQGTAQPNMTTPLTTINSTQSSTAQPVLRTTQNMTVIVSDSTTVQNTTLLTTTENTQLQNMTTAPQNTTEFITLSPFNVTLQITTTAFIDSTLNITTLSPNHTTEYNVTTADAFTSSTNHTTEYNVTTADAFTSSTNHTTEYNVTTADAFTSSTNHTTEYNVTTADAVTPSTNHATTADAVTPSTNHTTEYNVTTADAFTSSTNHTTEYNLSTANAVTPSTNHTTEYNATTANAFTSSTNHTTEYNVTTADAVTPSTNHTTEYNASTADAFTPSTNHTTEYNATTADAVTPSTNHTTEYNASTANAFTPSTNHTTEYNATTADAVTPSTNHTTEYNASTADAFTPSTNHTTEYNATTADAFTPSTNHTTEYNVTTVTPTGSSGKQYNSTITMTNTTDSTFTTSHNHTVVYNETTATKNYTTASNNYTTDYNVTTTNKNRTLHNSSITSNTTIGTFTTSPNHTVVYNVTTVANNYTTNSNNYTTEYNLTTADINRDLHNGTTSNATMSTFAPSPNYTIVNNAISQYTTVENITTTAVSRNKTATGNDTTAPIRETQQNTTLGNMTVVDNTAKPTVAPLNNQTANHTTARVTHNITTTSTSDANSTTATTTVNPIVSLNETAGINLSSNASSLTADVNVTTKGPGVNSTTTTTTITTTTTHDPLLTQSDTTTAKVSLSSNTTTVHTTTLTSTTTTKPGTGTTSTTIAETTTSQETQEEQANQLLDQTQDASQLNSSQVAQLVGQLEKILEGPTVSQAVGQKAINVISNLMGGDSVALSASANRLIRVVDDLGLKLVVAGDREVVSSDSLVLAVRTVDGTNFPTTSVDIFNSDNVQLRAFSRSRSKRSESALGSVFLPSSLTSGLSPEQQQQASRVQFTFYTKSAFFQDAALDNETLVSPVLGSSVANLSISNLSENIQFTIRNINPINANYVASCAFWDFTQNGGGGGWSSAGCFVVNATAEDTTCSCNHLTSFAILLDLSREGITDRQQAQILTFITYIGCGISAIFLAFTLLTYLLFEKLLRDIPAKILVQLCMSLLLLNLVFLLDGWLSLYPAIGLCISTAFFLHYFLLTSFTWAGLEALHMYLSVVQVFTPYLSRYMLKFSLMGWGIPLMVVIIVIAVDKDNYGLVTYGRYTDGTSDDFCWLRNDIAFYVGVVAYFLLIFSLCLVVFIMVMVQLARIKKQNPQNQAPNRGVMTDLRSIAGLVILLGLTWGFALFAWGPLYLPFVYLFSIFNTLQGFLVFIFHCAVKENVRRQWRTYLCCGRLRLAENSEWSRTATQNNRNLSVATATTTAPHFTSRSSSVISDGTNSSGSVFADSGISDGSNSDVLLNEIHRRNLSLQGEA
ncbi:adhesion G-protein coupled receptor G4 [Enoplosus armatus]|uniref:adhesion G-protein coupled receptor G4 n=1 Tax=Enoplosus armatus TaxID=215367 RepID=UPI0039953884